MFDQPPPDSRPSSARGLLDAIEASEARVRAEQARQLELIAAYAASQRLASSDDEVDAECRERAIALEVAGAVRVSIGSARMLVVDADDVTSRHHEVLEALRSGRIGLFAVRQIVAATRVLPADVAGGLDAALAQEAAQLLPGQVRAAADARVAAADLDAASRRAERARADKNVFFAPQPDGMAMLGATLPAEQALACWQALDDYARGRRADGDPRSIAHLMCDTLVESVTGAARADAPAAIELQIVMTDATLLGASDAQAELAGYGHIPADVARGLSAQAQTAIRRLLTDPIDSTVTGIDSRRRRFDGALRDFVIARDRRCRNPVCNAKIRDVDHRVEWATGGATTARNANGYCQRCHHLKDHPGVRVRVSEPPGRPPDAHRIVWHGPSGRAYNSLAPPALGHGTPTLEQLEHRRGLLERELEPT